MAFLLASPGHNLLQLSRESKSRRWVHDERPECCRETGCRPQTLDPTAVGGKGRAAQRTSQPGEEVCLLADGMSLEAIG